MICKNCGNEISNESVFCNKCGFKVDSIIENNKTIREPIEENPIVNNSKPIIENDNKRKYTIIAIVAVVVVIIISALFGGGNDYQGSGNNQPQIEDNFGVNNQTVTQPQTTEPSTAAPIDIEVIYDDIIYCEHGSDWGAVKITNYNMVYTDNGSGLTIFIDYEKVKQPESASKSSFVTNIYFYDASGNVIDRSQVLYVSNFDEGDIGKKYKGEVIYFGMLKANISAQAIAKIEIVGG